MRQTWVRTPVDQSEILTPLRKEKALALLALLKLQLAAKQHPLEVIGFKTCSPSESFGNHSIILFGYVKFHGWIISVKKMVTEYHLFINSLS